MKLTKSRLLRKVKSPIEELGYREFRDTTFGTSGFFAKRIDGYYLTLGLEISRYFDQHFSASYYFSKTTRWGSIWGDIPRESYRRISHFLTCEERTELLRSEFTGSDTKDAWWDGFDDDDLTNFIRCLNVSEDRLIDNQDIRIKVADSIEVQQMEMASKEVIRLYELKDLSAFAGKYVPDKEVDHVPIKWFKAAEVYIRESAGVLNKNTVRILAIDSFRINELDEVYESQK